MGISSSKSRQTTNQTQNTNQTTSGTTAPLTPDWLEGGLANFGGRIAGMSQMDPTQFVAPGSPLQQAAWNNAVPSLSGWQGQARTAAEMAQRAAGAPANMIGRPQGYSPAMAQAQTYGAPQLGSASLVSGQGYQAPTLGDAQGYAASRIGSPIAANATGYNNQMVGRTAIDPVTNASASMAQGGDIASRIARFQNPYERDVVAATQADLDNEAGRVRAAQAAQGARAGAFGGSRFGLREAQTEGELARARAGILSGLRAQGFNTAAGLAGQEAGMAQQNQQFNAGNLTNVSLANAGAANQRGLAQASLDQQGGMFNAESGNAARQFLAGATNQAGFFNADAANQTARAQAGLDTQAAADLAGARNQFALAGAGMQADAGRFNAGQAQQAAMANQGAQNQFALTQAGLQADAGQFNTGQANQMGLANMAAQNQAGQFNADAAMRGDMFNAGQADNANARALQGAGLMGSLASDYGSGTRQDLGTMAALGQQQREVEQAYRTAPLAQLQMEGAMYNAFPLAALVGQQVNGTNVGSMTGTETTTLSQSPSLFNTILGAASLGAGFLGGGGGGLSGLGKPSGGSAFTGSPYLDQSLMGWDQFGRGF